MIERRDFLKAVIAAPLVNIPLPTATLVAFLRSARQPPLIAIAGDRNEFLHMVVAIAPHGVESIGPVFLNGINAEDARFTNHVTVRKRLGHGTQSAAYLYVTLTWEPLLFPSGIPLVTVGEVSKQTMPTVLEQSP